MDPRDDRASDIFPKTNWSLLRATSATAPESRAALDELCSLYRQPVLLLVRRYGFDEADAEDLVQEYFIALLDRGFLELADAGAGRFRSFLRTDVKWFLHNARRKRATLRRGGGGVAVSLDRLRDESDFDASCLQQQPDIDDYFDRQCALEIVKAACTKLQDDYRSKGKEALFHLLQTGLTIPTGDRDYEAWAASLAMSPGSVKVAMHRLRERFRCEVEELVRQSVASEEDFRQEMHHLRHSLSHGAR
ncbi:MAG TPA: sigma-70 family RNA polymerase sigma factor [Bacteroidia bacterium]|nr:sigma-70 family RNA polymerase sigma factor [Bacteroidia bacterium]